MNHIILGVGKCKLHHQRPKVQQTLFKNPQMPKYKKESLSLDVGRHVVMCM